MSIFWLIIIGVISVALITVSIFCLMKINKHKEKLTETIEITNKTPIKDIPAYMVCLDRLAKERCDPAFDEYKKIFPKLERMSAVDAKNLDLETAEYINPISKEHIRNKVETAHDHITGMGQVGCYLSHVNMWKKCLEHDKPIIVIEDDVPKFNKNQVSELIKAYQSTSLLYINTLTTSGKDKKGDWGKIQPREFRGTQLYYITPKAASILLKYAFPISAQVDGYMGYILPYYDLNSYVWDRNFWNLSQAAQPSTLEHLMTFKKFLPESNLFYIVVITCVVILLVLSIIGVY
jgi:glycosyl transferase family 25